MQWKSNVIGLVFVLYFWTVTSTLVTSKLSKCSKHVSKIPVHKDLDIDKYLGTWYTVTRTIVAWGNDTYDSFVIEIRRNKDNSLSYAFTAKLNGVCSPIQTGILKPSRRLGEFAMKGLYSPYPRMIISYTDYHVALVYFCFKMRVGRIPVCRPDGVHVEVVSKSETPKQKDVDAYIHRATKRLCVPHGDLVPTPPGQCKLSDLREAESEEEVTQVEAKDTTPQTCIVDDIPIQAGYNLSTMAGTWYEIARTRNTINKMESVVTYSGFDGANGRLVSFYTGTLSPAADKDAQCQIPLRSVSKPKNASDEHGDLLAKIGEDDSEFPWAPMKILYADDQYVMTYACYTGQTDKQCKKKGTEVSIMGRTRDLNTTARDKMFALLPSICIEEKEIIETDFLANCSSNATEAYEAMQEKEQSPSDCYLNNMIVFDDYRKTELQGHWFLYAYIHFNNSAARSGVVMSKLVSESHTGETTETILVSFDGVSEDGERTCANYTARSRERCLDTADQITTIPYLDDSNFVFSKILHLSDSLLIEYSCTKMTMDGRCVMDGILFNAYKNISMENVEDDDLDLVTISLMAQSVCLDPDLLEFETEWCPEELLGNSTTPAEMTDDDVDSLTIYSDYEDFYQEDMHGYWYLIAHSYGSNELADLQSLVAYIIADTNSSLRFYYTGNYNGSDYPACSGVAVTSMVARCLQESNGDYLYQYKVTKNYILYAPYKILYLEKDSVMVTYICQHVLPDGRCNASEANVRIWGRNRTIDQLTRETATDMLYWANIDPSLEGFMIDDVQEENESCDNPLEEYLESNEIGDIQENDEDNSDEDSEEKEQKDEQEYGDDDDDDFEAELTMTDEEFYYGS